jgi:hypothetical protein
MTGAVAAVVMAEGHVTDAVVYLDLPMPAVLAGQGRGICLPGRETGHQQDCFTAGPTGVVPTSLAREFRGLGHGGKVEHGRDNSLAGQPNRAPCGGTGSAAGLAGDEPASRSRKALPFRARPPCPPSCSEKRSAT